MELLTYIDNITHFFSLMEFRQGATMGQLYATLMENKEKLLGKNSSSMTPLLTAQAFQTMENVRLRN